MRRSFPPAILLAAVVGLSAAGSRAQPAVPSFAGSFGPMALVVRGDRVAGAYHSLRQGGGTPGAPQFSCIFLFRGRLEGGRATVEAWVPGDPGRIAGTLEVRKRHRVPGQASLQLSASPPGCDMTGDTLVGEGVSAGQDRSAPGWIGLGMVTAGAGTRFRATLFPAPRDTGPPGARLPYVTDADIVAVLERRPGWLRVGYLPEQAGEAPLVTGWLRADQVAEVPPDQRGD